jgi:hypothetical protein
VSNFEQGRPVSADAVQTMQRALEKAGVEFTNGDRPGVRLRAKLAWVMLIAGALLLGALLTGVIKR